MSQNYEVDVKKLDPKKLHLKYVTSYHFDSKTFYVSWVRDWYYHVDCNIPKGFRAVAAGWVSVPRDEMQTGNYDNAETWGGSVGLDLCPHTRDLAMLKQNLTDGVAFFDKDGKPVDEATVMTGVKQ